MRQEALFPIPSPYPEGLRYQPDFLEPDAERGLLDVIRTLPFVEARYKEWRARRRIVAYGGRYDFSRNELNSAPPVPLFLQALRDRIAQWSGIDASLFNHAMIAEYAPQTPLGWHRDVPQFEDIVGVSLLGHARMRFRRYPPKHGGRAAFALDLEPRSIYALRGPARWNWQHAVSPTRELRYSITFRTLSVPK